MIAVEEITKILGGKVLFKRPILSVADLEQAVDEGLPKGTLIHTISAAVPDKREALAMRNRVVPPATYKRRKRFLSLEESQRVERLARVIATAFFVWDDQSLARQFLTTAHALLENRRPLDVAATDLGARRVEDLLWALAHGLPV